MKGWSSMRGMTVIFLIAAVLSFGLPASACLGPTNVEGVAFTNGEKLNFDSISALGTAGVNYQTVLSDKGGTSVSYPCHYDSKAMVFFGNMGTLYQQNAMINCFGVIYPLSEEMMNSHTPISKEVFNFTAAVKTELEWLSAHKIIALDNGTIDTIVDGLKSTNNGGMQYWTFQKKTLAYNSWYTYDTLHGTWGGVDLDAVNSVKSVRGVNGCSGVQLPAFEVLQPFTVRTLTQRAENSPVRFTLMGNTIKMQELQSNETVDIKVVSITGKIIKSSSVKGASSCQIELGNFVPGAYLLRLSMSGATVNKPVVIH
jgi:hypothetical protein